MEFTFKTIKKLQEGGQVSAPYVQYTPFFTQYASQESKPTSTKSSNSTDAAQKQLQEVIGNMVGKGLNNEVRYFAQRVDDLLLNSEILGEPISVRQYTAIVSQLNEIQNNKAIFDEARKHALENGTLSEAAITFDGNFYAQNKNGQLQMITPEQYAAKRGDYKLLTNDDILNLRNNSNSLIFDTTISQTVAGSMSISDISTEIDNAIKMIQKEDSSSDMYLNKARANEFNLEMQALVQSRLGTAPDNLYKITTETSTQRNHLNTALVRIWNKLSQQAKNTLIAQSAITEEGDPRQNAYKALADIITYGTYHKESISITDEGEIDPITGRKSNTSGSGSTTEMGPLEIYATAPKSKNYTVQLGSDISLNSNAYIGPLVGVDNKLQNNNYIGDIINKGGLGALLDPNGASLGTGEVLSSTDLDKILYTNDQIATTWLPSIRTSNGSKVVDLEIMQRIQEVQKEIEGLQNPTQEAIDEVYAQHEVPEYLYKGTQPSIELIQAGLVAQFMVIPAYVPGDVAKKTTIKEKGVQPLDSDQRSDALDAYSRVRAQASNKEQRNQNYKPSETFFFDSIFGEDIYKTSVFIPLTDEVLIRGAANGNAPLISKDRMSWETRKYNQDRIDNSKGIKDNNIFGI